MRLDVRRTMTTLAIALAVASVALLPATASADPGPDDTAAARLDPDYAAGRHAIPCEEKTDLEKAIAEYRRAGK